MWVGRGESPGSSSISAINYWFNVKQVTSPLWVTWGPFLSALNLSLLMRPFMYPEFVRCLHGYWAMERAHNKHVLNQWDQAIAAGLYQQGPKLIWRVRLTVQQLSDLMTVEPCSSGHSCLSLTFPQTFMITTVHPGSTRRRKESPDLRHLLFLQHKDSHQGQIQATDKTSQNADLGINTIGSHELVPAGSSAPQFSPPLTALFLTLLLAPLLPEIPKCV